MMSGHDDHARACACRRFLPAFALLCLVLAITQAFSTPCHAQVVERLKLIASDTTPGDSFGFAVATSGNTAIVAAPHHKTENGLGAAYLFDTTTGQELVELTVQSEGIGSLLGSSVGISGNIAIAGAPADKRDGVESGSAHLFDVTTGQELFKLTALDAASGDQFGTSVAISGNVAIVGARNDDDDGRDSGSAYLFDVTTGQELFKLTASDAAAGDLFGESVGISGNVAIVGAPSGFPEPGSAYLFDVTTGQQLHALTASGTAMRDSFGDSVAIDGETAIVGAFTDDDAGDGSGSAYLFDVPTGQELLKLTASDTEPFDHFSHRGVGISANIAIVGAHLSGDDTALQSGSAYDFNVTTGQELSKLTASDVSQGSDFGWSVSVSGSTAVVGSNGAAYVFSVPEPSSFVLSALALMALLGCAARR